MSTQTRSPWPLLFTVLFGTLLVGIDRTVTNLAIPHIISDFHINASTAGWVATAYIITSAIFIPVFGKLGDMYGDRSVFIGGMAGFMLTSLFTALAWNSPFLIIFRALQGICGAAILPTAIAAITKGFTERSARAQALGIWTSTNAGAAAIAPLLGGPLIDHFGWRSVFFINLPLGVISIILAGMYIHNDRVGKSQKFDILGSVLLGAALTAFVLVVDRGNTWGWTSLGSLICYTSVLVFGWLFFIQQSRTNDPIVDLKLFKNPTTSSALATTFLTAMSLYSVTLLLSLFAQNSLGYTATQTGYLYLPMTIPLFFISPVGAKVSRWLPPRFAIGIGMLGAAGAIYLLSNADISQGLRAVSLPLALFGAFWGITSSPLSTAIASSVPKTHVGMISGLRNLFLSIGGAVGIAIYSSVYTRNQQLGISSHTTFHLLYGFAALALVVGALISLLINEKSSDYS